MSEVPCVLVTPIEGGSVQRTLTYFVRGSITVRRATRLTRSNSIKQINMLLIQHLIEQKHLNLKYLNKLNRRSAIQWYFPISECTIKRVFWFILYEGGGPEAGLPCPYPRLFPGVPVLVIHLSRCDWNFLLKLEVTRWKLGEISYDGLNGFSMAIVFAFR